MTDVVAPTSRTAPYRAVIASRVRSQRSHRASFRVDLLSSLLVGVVALIAHLTSREQAAADDLVGAVASSEPLAREGAAPLPP